MKLTKCITIIASVIFAMATTSLHAQITDKGNFLVGGTLGFSSAESSFEIEGNNGTIDGQGTRSTLFNIAPAIGYFFAPNFAVGVGLDYTVSRVEEPEDVTDPESPVNEEFDSDLLFGPYARYYLPVGEDKAFFVETTFGFGSSLNEFEVDEGTQTTSTNVLAVGVGPGFTIFSNDAIGIEALAKYNWARSRTDIDFQGIETETTSFTNAIDFSVGLQVYFTRLQTVSTNEGQ